MMTQFIKKIIQQLENKNKVKPKMTRTSSVIKKIQSIPILLLSLLFLPELTNSQPNIRILQEKKISDAVILIIILACLVIVGICIGYIIHCLNPQTVDANDPNQDPNALPNQIREQTQQNINENVPKKQKKNIQSVQVNHEDVIEFSYYEEDQSVKDQQKRQQQSSRERRKNLGKVAPITEVRNSNEQKMGRSVNEERRKNIGKVPPLNFSNLNIQTREENDDQYLN